MKVSAVKQQIKQPHRYSIFVDGVYSFSLNNEDVYELRIFEGADITPELLERCMKLSRNGKQYNAAIRLLSIRWRSRQELSDYFRRKGVAEEEAAEIIDKLDRQGYVDDERFAAAWVASRRKYKYASRARIGFELRQKGVASEVIKNIFAGETYDDTAVLEELILKKRRLVRYQDDQKLIRYLLGKGYTYSDITQVLKCS